MLSPKYMQKVADRVLSDELKKKLKDVHFQDAGHGYDPFGLHPSAIHMG